MTTIEIESEFIILDACCILNLYASLSISTILGSFPVPAVISEYVQREEVLYHYSGPEENVRAEKSKINLQPLCDSGLIRIIPLDPEIEGRIFLEFASQLDDGEAVTCAIAISRQWTIGTDDKKTIQLLESRHPEISVITTPDMVRHWAEKTQANAEEIRKVIRNISLRARYSPPSNHPLYSWWLEYEL